MTAASPCVLIVDDEIGVRESLRAVLASSYTVLTADSGEAALELIADGGIDLMTLDIRMPGMGGMRVLERARTLDPDIEVLIVTGYGSLDTAVQGLRHRAFDYISKPFDVVEVRRLVDTALARRATIRRMRNLPDQLLASWSHELRNPLNVIMGYTTFLQQEANNALSEEHRHALDRVQANSSQLLAYVESFLFLAELDSGLAPTSTEPIAVAQLLGRLADTLAPAVAERALRLRVEAPSNLVLLGDADKLGRLLYAVASNAVRFTAEGHVTLTACAASGGVRFEVRDSGPGIPPETTREVANALAGGNAAGLGVGLRLAARLARFLSASLSFVSEPGGTICRLDVQHAAETPVAKSA
jgi:signal transduction histidine kinase